MDTEITPASQGSQATIDIQDDIEEIVRIGDLGFIEAQGGLAAALLTSYAEVFDRAIDVIPFSLEAADVLFPQLAIGKSAVTAISDTLLFDIPELDSESIAQLKDGLELLVEKIPDFAGALYSYSVGESNLLDLGLALNDFVLAFHEDNPFAALGNEGVAVFNDFRDAFNSFVEYQNFDALSTNASPNSKSVLDFMAERSLFESAFSSIDAVRGLTDLIRPVELKTPIDEYVDAAFAFSKLFVEQSLNDRYDEFYVRTQIVEDLNSAYSSLFDSINERDEELIEGLLNANFDTGSGGSEGYELIQSSLELPLNLDPHILVDIDRIEDFPEDPSDPIRESSGVYIGGGVLLTSAHVPFLTNQIGEPFGELKTDSVFRFDFGEGLSNEVTYSISIDANVDAERYVNGSDRFTNFAAAPDITDIAMVSLEQGGSVDSIDAEFLAGLENTPLLIFRNPSDAVGLSVNQLGYPGVTFDGNQLVLSQGAVLSNVNQSYSGNSSWYLLEHSAPSEGGFSGGPIFTEYVLGDDDSGGIFLLALQSQSLGENSGAAPLDLIYFEMATQLDAAGNADNFGQHALVVDQSTGGTLTGTFFHEHLLGSEFVDILNGGEGNDDLYGGDASDHLSGGTGDDGLNGGTGRDDLWGGADDDLFVFDAEAFADAKSSILDTIKDFRQGNGQGYSELELDQIDVSAIVAESYLQGQSVEHLVKFERTQTDGLLRLLVDPDGTNSAENWVALAILAGVPSGADIDPILVSGMPPVDLPSNAPSAPGSYTVSPASQAVVEGSTTIEFTVTRPDDTLAETVYVSTTRDRGTSDNDGDYEGFADQELTFAAGADTATVTVNILDDGSDETVEIFGLVVQAAPDPDLNPDLANNLASASFTIIDDDAEGDTVNFTEGADNEWITPSGGTEVFDGLGGTDVVTVDLRDWASASTTIDGSSRTFTTSGSSVRFDNIEQFVVIATPGNDTITTGDDNDIILGGDGDDVINAGDGTDAMDGGDGNDTFLNVGLLDIIAGGAGIDTVNFNASVATQDLTINLDTGQGLLGSWTGIERISGDLGQGDDSVTAGALYDYLYAEGGTDFLKLDYSGGFAGRTDLITRINLRLDNDTTTSSNTSVAEYVYYTDENGNNANAHVAHFAGFEQFDITGSDGNDVIYTKAGDDTIIAGDGNDDINAGAGADYIDAGDGDDVITTGSGADVLSGVASDLSGDAVRDFMSEDCLIVSDLPASNIGVAIGAASTVISFTSTVDGSAIGEMVLEGDFTGTGFQLLGNTDGSTTIKLAAAGMGQLTNDADRFITNDPGGNLIVGLDGEDAIVSGGGADTVEGGDGSDLIKAGDGADLVIGGKGSDIATGGDGADIFAFDASDYDAGGFTADYITDFTSGEDVIELSGFGPIDFAALSFVTVASGDAIDLGKRPVHRAGGPDRRGPGRGRHHRRGRRAECGRDRRRLAVERGG